MVDSATIMDACNSNLRHLLNLRLTMFMIIVGVYCTALTIILAFNAIRVQQAADAVHKQSNLIAINRKASCAYTADFEKLFHRWTYAIGSIAVSKDPTVNRGRDKAFKRLFKDLHALGSKACPTAPTP